MFPSNVGKIELGRLGLRGVLFVEVPERLDVLVAEKPIAVEVHFRVERDDVPVLGQHQRVDLGQGAIGVDEGVVEPHHELDRLAGQLGRDR
jgi:hypothetical protein